MVVVVIAAAVLAAGLIGFWIGRRLGSAVAAPASPGSEARPGTETGAERLDQEGERPAPGPGRHSARVDIERALADLRLGVVVAGPGGEEVYRNNLALRYATGRHGDALVEAAIERVVDGALVGLSLEEMVEVYGPPARSLLVQASPTYDDGVVSSAVCIVEDVTMARHSDRVRSDFVANVSHELRTPVGALSVLAETIATADDPAVVERLAQRMQREANRLGNTIEDLLALSRLESGPTAEPETIDLVSVAVMAVERTGEAAEQRGVTVALHPANDGPVLVEGDRGQLVSAAANLIDNAIKYSDPGGAVTVQVAASGTAGIGRAELSVIDEGMGIPDRDLDRIFERFYRVDTARSRETGGTGLGLSIVRHAVLNHDGTVDVSSVEGRGSTFTIRLPQSADQAKIANRPSSGAAPGRSDQWMS